MAKYDPNWLQKLQAKQAAKAPALSHIEDKNRADGERSRAICGQGFGAKGHPSITFVIDPSVSNLPRCRNCREALLNSLGVAIDPANGYPVGYVKP
jgi:hypothetical protein